MSAPLGITSLSALLQDSGQLVTQGLVEGFQYQLQVFTSNGTFTPPTPPSGYEIAYYIGTVYGGGYSGDRVGPSAYVVGRGGRPGGRHSRRISVTEMGAGLPITVGSGGAARTSNGKGNAGGESVIGTLLSSSAGASAIPTPYGDLPSSSAPGWGGDGGMLGVDGDSYTYGPGGDGQDTSGALGGVGGSPAGWFGGSSRSPGGGADGQIDGDHTTGGAGGGGGGSGSGGTQPKAQAGAAGGAPGGGGGAAGATTTKAGAANPNSGPGGRGQVDVLTVFKPIAA